jgi:hypothetical protein
MLHKYGRVFMSKVWRPKYLRVIYETHNDAIVYVAIDVIIEGRKPKLISVF